MEHAGRRVEATWRALAAVPVPLRFALLGGVSVGALGAVAGLVIGLRVHAPTAWFAVVEVGLPTALVGLVLGLIVGSVVHLVSRRRGQLPNG